MASVTKSRLSSSIATLCRASWSMATRSPSRVAPSRILCTVRGRCPTPVNISGRVRVTLTGRPATRAASAASTTCCHARNPAPKPPARYGACTRTADSGIPNAPATTVRTLEVNCEASCRTTVSPSHTATVANSPSGLFVFSAVV